jgi:hypothetical protein
VSTPGPQLARSRRPRIPVWRAGALVGLILGLLIVGDLPIVHDHGTPGLYNEECPLARLATASPRASVSPDLDQAMLVRTPEAVPAAPRAVRAPFSPASFDPRAPPFLPAPVRVVIG